MSPSTCEPSAPLRDSAALAELVHDLPEPATTDPQVLAALSTDASRPRPSGCRVQQSVPAPPTTSAAHWRGHPVGGCRSPCEAPVPGSPEARSPTVADTAAPAACIADDDLPFGHKCFIGDGSGAINVYVNLGRHVNAACGGTADHSDRLQQRVQRRPAHLPNALVRWPRCRTGAHATWESSAAATSENEVLEYTWQRVTP
jgi:hypothetical protein